MGTQDNYSGGAREEGGRRREPTLSPMDAYDRMGGREGGREGEASDGMACYADDPLPVSHQGLSQSRAEWSEEESEREALLETRTGPL